MRTGALAIGVAAIAFVASPVPALETDQFFAWKQPLTDATSAVNEKVNTEMVEALARLNSRHERRPCSCREARAAIRDHFYYLIFARPEIWASQTSLVDRIPETLEEESRFRRWYLYRETSPLDPIRWMPPSPTIEMAGVRMGTDKLGHFFADGAWIEAPYRRALAKGATDEEAVRQAIRFSLVTERTILGMSSSGVMSLADMEANYQGLLFYRGLCDGPDAALVLTPSGWSLKRRFDFRDYVTPEWDESWQPNIYAPSRWAKVRPVMRRYCALLQDPEIQRQRAGYAARDRDTPTELIVRELVASGKLADPTRFTIEAACAAPASANPSGSGR